MESSLTLSGKYVLSKLVLVEGSTLKDSVIQSGQLFTSSDLPDPFDSLKVNDFFIHFDYSTIRMVWYNKNQTGQGDRWEYGESPYEIYYYRVPWSYDAYNLGKIQFDYKPKDKSSYRRVILQVDSDLLESIQLSGLYFSPIGNNGPNYKLVMSFTRIGP